MVLFRIDRLLRKSPAEGRLPSEKELLARTMYIVWPSVLESFLVAFLGMLDTLMVSVLGTYAIAAVGLATQPKLVGLAVFLSINVSVSVIVARRAGEGKRESANKFLLQMLLVSSVLSIGIGALCVVLADPIIRFVGSEPETHAEAVAYFRMVMGWMVFNVVSLVINAAQRGAGNTKISIRTNTVSNIINIVFNYLLISGKCGFPALGVRGAAVASVLGSVVACAMSVLSLFHKDGFLNIRFMRGLKPEKETFQAVFRVGASSFAEQVIQRAGLLLFAAMVARLGTDAFAAHQIGLNFIAISFSFGDGLAAASVSLIGQSLGQKRSDLAQIYGGICRRIGVLFALGFSAVFLLFGREFFRLYSSNEIVIDYGVTIMRIMTVIAFLQIMQVVFSGCLRGVGDTKFAAWISLLGTTLVRPIAAWVLCYPMKMGLAGAWIALTIDQAVRFFLSWLRFRLGRKDCS